MRTFRQHITESVETDLLVSLQKALPYVKRISDVILKFDSNEAFKFKLKTLLRARADNRYTSTEALRNQMRTGHHGPWK
jgi:hypothetical protein